MPRNLESPLRVPCPTCKARRGKRCAYSNGTLCPTHQSRVDLARSKAKAAMDGPGLDVYFKGKKGRIHRDKPPHGTCPTHSDGFSALLERLYQLEDSVSPIGGRDAGPMFADCRAICEHFLPMPLREIMRSKYG